MRFLSLSISWSLLFLFMSVELVRSDLLQIQKLKVVKGYLSHTTLQCPIPASTHIPLNQIRWVNEANDYAKPDSGVQLTANNVLASSQLAFQTFDSLTYLSCGYISESNCYVRLKLWQLICVDPASVHFQIEQSSTLINLAYINVTYGQITVNNYINWNSQLDLLRLSCVNNFDYPLTSKYVWMYVKNTLTNACETWYTSELSGFVDAHKHQQMFFSPDQNRNAPLNSFLSNLCSNNNYQLTFQCASYFERGSNSDRVYLIADSANFTLTCAANTMPTTAAAAVAASNSNMQINYGALIGGIIGGVLGFLLLLALLAFLFWYCWLFSRNRKEKTTAVVTERVISNHNIDIDARSNSIVFPGMAVASTSVGPHHLIFHNSADKSAQFANQIEISNMDDASSYAMHNVNMHSMHNTVEASAAPYMRTITIQKDVSDEDDISLSNEIITTTTKFETNEHLHDRFVERRDYYVQNYQQHQHQNDIVAHYI